MKSGIAQGYSLLIEKYNIDSWKNLNSEIASTLKLDKFEIQSYLGLHHAIKEITTGLSHLFMHKMSIGVVAGCDYFVDQVAKDFSRLGYKIQTLTTTSLKEPKQGLEGLAKDTLLVMYAEDHPLTGEIFDTSELRKTLAIKKIFSVGISHRLQFYQPMPEKLESHEVKIWSSGVGRAIALLGDRIKINVPITSNLNWQEFSRESFCLPTTSEKEDKALVDNFEKNSPNSSAFFKLNENRIFDRAIVVWPDIDAAALVAVLEVELNLKPGTIFTTSLCHWPNPKLVEWMRGNPLSDAELRGMAIFNLNFLRTPDVIAQIKLAREKILKLQG